MIDDRGIRSKIMLALFAVATILLPFNALPYFKSIFREMANEGAFYPLMLATLLYAWHLIRGKIYLPKHSSFAFLVMFFVWVGISGVANFLGIIEATTKGRSGSEKYIFQYLLLLFVITSSLLIYQMAQGDSRFLLKFRRYATYSIIPVSVYCLVEVMAIFDDAGAIKLLQIIDYFIRDEEIGVAIFRRLRSVSGEPSYFAMYISLVFPWVFSYLITEEKRRGLCLVLVAYLIGLVLFTLSRSAYSVLGIQILFLMLGVAFHSGRGARHSMLVLATVTLVSVVAAFGILDLIPFDDIGGVLSSLFDMENISNIGRYGSQAAAYGMSVNNPVFGVGFGQYGFKMPDYVPDWAMISPEIQEWMSISPDSVWAPALGLYARVAGELGFIGLFLWIFLWLSLLQSCYRRFKLNITHLGRCDGIGLALLVSMVGILMAGFNSDSLRFFGYWFLLGLSWIYLGAKEAPGKVSVTSPTL